MKTNILALSALLLTSLPAVAEQITITLDTPTVNAQPGQTVQLTAQLVNNSGFTIDLNGIVLNMFGQFTVDTNPFFTGPATIGPNQTLQLFPLANITVADPFTDPLGIYLGTITLQGGAEGPGGYDPSSQDILGQSTVAFNVDAAGVPEPASLGLCLAGVTGILLARHRRTAFR